MAALRPKESASIARSRWFQLEPTEGMGNKLMRIGKIDHITRNASKNYDAKP